jgi:uncharacterized protein
MATVLITGGTGLLGKQLSQKLQAKGYTVTILSRHKNPNSAVKQYIWDYTSAKIDEEAIATADYIIHLAGTSVADKRWTERQKKDIIDSRVLTGNLLFDTVKKQNQKLHAFISASAIGYYGAVTTDKIFEEEDAPCTDFLGTVCKQWEATADQFTKLNIRTVKLRIGVVLTKKDGPLAKIKAPIDLGIGSALGTGNQYMPWIHVDDLCDMFIYAMENATMHGSYNAAAPEQISNEAFSKTFAAILDKPFWAPNVPAFVLKILFGELANVFLTGSRVSVEKILSTGFKFRFPNANEALTDLTTKD